MFKQVRAPELKRRLRVWLSTPYARELYMAFKNDAGVFPVLYDSLLEYGVLILRGPNGGVSAYMAEGHKCLEKVSLYAFVDGTKTEKC